MMAGVAAIAFSSASGKEQEQWKEASHRESRRYNISTDFVDARMQGMQLAGETKPSRTLLDWLLVAIATGVFVFFAAMARAPRMSFQWGPAALLVIATATLCIVCGFALWRTTRFN